MGSSFGDLRPGVRRRGLSQTVEVLLAEVVFRQLGFFERPEALPWVVPFCPGFCHCSCEVVKAGDSGRTCMYWS